MALGFKPARKHGVHFDLASLAVKRLKGANLLLKGKTERHFEHTVVAFLEGSPKLRKNLITQVGDEDVEKISQAALFGFKHRPDTTIGNDGTAIELKVITTSTSVRVLLGQALAYRMAYRFVVLVLVDRTPDRQVVTLCQDKHSQEYALLTGLAKEFNIFTVVGPVERGKNLAFVAKGSGRPKTGSQKSSSETQAEEPSP